MGMGMVYCHVDLFTQIKDIMVIIKQQYSNIMLK